MDPSNCIDFEISRLAEQAKCWEPEAETLFERIPVHPGWKRIDLGCGPEGVLRSLNQKVGSYSNGYTYVMAVFGGKDGAATYTQKICCELQNIVRLANRKSLKYLTRD